MEKLKVRHFILCQDMKINAESLTFSVSGVYEFFLAKSYPTRIDFKAVLGLYFLHQHENYTVNIIISQNEKRIGQFLFEGVSVEKDFEIMNFILGAEINIFEEGKVQFDIVANGEIVDTQIVLAVRED